LSKFRTLWRMPACLVFATCLAGTQAVVSADTFEYPESALSPSWSLESLWQLPLLSWFAPSIPVAALEIPEGPPPPPCLVEPLSEVTDPEAQDFEAAVGTFGTVNTAGLTRGTARALNRFEKIVLSAGGRMLLTSAYRPAAYQAHLQELWDKWMIELRFETDEACAPLRATVGDEFLRHGLLESQRPATVSDHTRGLSFDAAVILPSGARLRRRRVGIDSLARMAGVRRPAILADPVHFRLM
jgi:hypothetical protein